MNAKTLDFKPKQAQHKPRNANTLHGFSSLINVADMPLLFRGFFVSAFLFCSLFLWAARGGRLMPAGHVTSLLTRLFAVRQCLAAFANNP